MHKNEIREPDAPATRRQLWALFCITKQDHRDKGLTRKEASDLISKFNGEGCPNGRKVTFEPVRKDSWVQGPKTAIEIIELAERAGTTELKNCVPKPMVVAKHVNMLDDSSPVEKEWFVEGGVCGFAWVNFKCKTATERKFLNELKKAGLASSDINSHKMWKKDDYYKGFTYWVSVGGQSMARKEAFGAAFAEVLNAYGINAHMMSRMD